MLVSPSKAVNDFLHLEISSFSKDGRRKCSSRYFRLTRLTNTLARPSPPPSKSPAYSATRWALSLSLSTLPMRQPGRENGPRWPPPTRPPFCAASLIRRRFSASLLFCRLNILLWPFFVPQSACGCGSAEEEGSQQGTTDSDSRACVARRRPNSSSPPPFLLRARPLIVRPGGLFCPTGAAGVGRTAQPMVGPLPRGILGTGMG